ncbi:MAG: hypothetical protein WA445_20265 [Pseudolabrys sp.]
MAKGRSPEHAGELVVVFVMNTNETEPHRLNTCDRRRSRVLQERLRHLASAKNRLRASGPDAVYYATRLRGASNEKAGRELEFRPRPLEWI